MPKAILTAAVVLFGLAAVPAGAMPLAPFSSGASDITLAAMGCGPGWTRGPYGRCHPMGYVQPYYYHPYAHHCWWSGGVRLCR